jgi:tetratricopeptide (TPR) repeat protein
MDQIALQDQVDRIVGGVTFAQKAQLRSLLRILADHYQSQTALQPARVIRDLWPDDGSRESRDLAAAMYRLRHALGEYYAGEGASDRVLISLPRRAGEAAGEGGFRHWITAEFLEPSGAVCDRSSAEPGEVQPVSSQAEIGFAPAGSARQTASFRTVPFLRRLIAAIPGIVILLAALAYLLHAVRLNSLHKTSRTAASAGDLRHVPVPDAEQLYLRGRYFWNLRTADSLAKATDFYTQAIVKDPSYAEAYAGLAETYDLLPQFGQADFGDSLTKAKAAADRAIALNPNLPAAHTARAFALFYWDWDITDSDAEFRKAIALDPDSPQAHHWYASTLSDRWEREECLKQIDEAQRLNPASAAIAADAAAFHATFGDFDAGVKALKEIEQTQPSLATPPDFLAGLYFATGDYPGYIAETRHYGSITRNPYDVQLADAVARGWAEGGSTGLLEAKAEFLKSSFERGDESGFWLGQTLVQLGRPREALPYFQASLKRRHIWLITMEKRPWAKPFASDPGYAALFAEIRTRVHGDIALHADVPISSHLPR